MFDAFALTDVENITFSFENNLHAPIEAGDLPGVIAQYKNCGCFFVEILLDEPVLSVRAEVSVLFFYS